MATIGELAVNVTARTGGLAAGLRSGQRSINGFAATMAKTTGTAVAGFGRVASSVGSVVGVTSALGGVGFGIKLAAETEQATVAFTTMLGSVDKAKVLLGELKTFASSTPFQFPELRTSAQKLVAFGVAASDIPQTLQRIGDVSAGIGSPIGEIAEIYGKARVQGRLFAEDINQLTGRGIPLVRSLAEQFGVAESEVRGLVESGSVNFGHLEQAFTSMTGEGGQFAGLMQAQSKTVAGAFSTLKDNVGLALEGIGTTILEGFDLATVTGNVAQWVADNKNTMVTFGQNIGTVFSNIPAIIAVTMDKGALAFTSFVEDAKFGFVETLPGVIRALPTIVSEVFTNIISNTANFRAALFDAIQGKGFNFVFAPLTDEFAKAIADIPAIANRELTSREKFLGQSIRDQENAIGATFLNSKTAEATVDPKTFPKVADLPTPAPVVTATQVPDAAVTTVGENAAIIKGSAEAFSLRAQRGNQDTQIAREQLETQKRLVAIMERVMPFPGKTLSEPDFGDFVGA